MYIVFYSTSDVLRAEGLLSKHSIECQVVPTPVRDKAYCGVCVQVSDSACKDLLVKEDMEFEIIEWLLFGVEYDI